MRSGLGVISVIGLLQVAAVLTVAFSLLTSLDIPHRNIELFTHFRLQYFVASLLLLVVFAGFRNYPYAGVLLLTAIFNGFLVVPWYQGKPPPTPGTPLTLVHANVLASNTDYQRLIDFVKTEAPDVVFLQEITNEWVTALQELQQDYPYMYAEPRFGNFGIAALSRLPFDSIRHIDSPPLGYPSIFAQITVNDEPLTLVSSHPTIPLGRQLYEARNEQLESVGEIVSKLRGEVVLLGDFNASMWCPKFRQLESTVQLRNAREGFGILPTWPTFLPPAMIPIDHALVSEGISVLDIRTGSRIGSDHLPLIVTVSL